MNRIINFLKEEEGVTAIEYALIAALVGVVSIVGWSALGTNINGQATTVAGIVGNPAAAVTAS